MYVDGDGGFHEVFLGLHVERVHVELHLVGEQISHAVEQSCCIQSSDFQFAKECNLTLGLPFGFHDIVAVTCRELDGLGAVAAVDLKRLAGEAERDDVVAGDGIAARRHVEVELARRRDGTLFVLGGCRYHRVWP